MRVELDEIEEIVPENRSYTPPPQCSRITFIIFSLSINQCPSYISNVIVELVRVRIKDHLLQ